MTITSRRSQSISGVWNFVNQREDVPVIASQDVAQFGAAPGVADRLSCWLTAPVDLQVFAIWSSSSAITTTAP
jgi:hypothetical protein